LTNLLHLVSVVKDDTFYVYILKSEINTHTVYYMYTHSHQLKVNKKSKVNMIRFLKEITFIQ